MGKDFKGVSQEVVARRSKGHILSFTALLGPAPPERFAELLSKESKIRIFIKDFSQGKGDNAVDVYFNWEISQFQYIFNRAQRTWDNAPFRYGSRKIYGNNKPDRDGMVRAMVFMVSREKQTPAENGELLPKEPWKFQIWNGRAVAELGDVEGFYHERENTFVCERYAEVSLSDAECFTLLKRVDDYLTNYMRLASDILIPAGEDLMRNMAACEEKGIIPTLRSTRLACGHPPGAEQTPGPETSVGPACAQNAPGPEPIVNADCGREQTDIPDGNPCPDGSTAVQGQEAAPPLRKRSGTMDIVLVDVFYAVDGYAASRFECRGKEYSLFVPMDLFEQIQETFESAYRTKEVLRVYIEQRDIGLVCTGLA